MERLQPKLIEIRIGSISAKCGQCGGTQFERAMRAAGLYSDSLICASCRAETNRAALVAQVGNEVVRQGKQFLEAKRVLRKP